jgi:GNAT superfamily N-acetyltransferase
MNAQLRPELTLCVEALADSLDELKPMFPAHFAELALDQDKVPLDPRYGVYLDLEKRGEVLFIALRNAGEIAGYFVGFVRPHLHYQTCLTLSMDIFWVRPDFRGNGGGYRLFRFVEAEAKRRGVQRMLVGSKLHKDASWLFEKLGYTEVERYYSVWLGE